MDKVAGFVHALPRILSAPAYLLSIGRKIHFHAAPTELGFVNGRFWL